MEIYFSKKNAIFGFRIKPQKIVLPVEMKIGNKIRKIREIKDITPKDMADRLDLSLPGYSKIEGDKVSINMERLTQIAEIFKMKPEEVLTFDEKFIFNTYDNSIGIGINHGALHQFSEELKKLYEDKIKLQQDMIELLKKQLNS